VEFTSADRILPGQVQFLDVPATLIFLLNRAEVDPEIPSKLSMHNSMPMMDRINWRFFFSWKFF